MRKETIVCLDNVRWIYSNERSGRSTWERWTWNCCSNNRRTNESNNGQGNRQSLIFVKAKRKSMKHHLLCSLKGKADPLNSAFKLTYNMVLNLLRVEGINPEFMLERSFYQFQHFSSIPALYESCFSILPLLWRTRSLLFLLTCFRSEIVRRTMWIDENRKWRRNFSLLQIEEKRRSNSRSNFENDERTEISPSVSATRPINQSLLKRKTSKLAQFSFIERRFRFNPVRWNSIGASFSIFIRNLARKFDSTLRFRLNFSFLEFRRFTLSMFWRI